MTAPTSNDNKKPDGGSHGPGDEALSLRFYLSGDFASPLELLAENSLSNSQKREVLEMWLAEIRRHGRDAELIELNEQIEKLLAELPED